MHSGKGGIRISQVAIIRPAKSSVTGNHESSVIISTRHRRARAAQHPPSSTILPGAMVNQARTRKTQRKIDPSNGNRAPLPSLTTRRAGRARTGARATASVVLILLMFLLLLFLLVLLAVAESNCQHQIQTNKPHKTRHCNQSTYTS